MKLSQKEISYLAGILPAKSKLSIFYNIQVETDGTEEKTLTEKGILKNGAIAEAYTEIITAAAEAEKCGRLVLRDSGYFIEKYTYKGKNSKGEALTVLVENDNGDMVFRTIDDFKELILSLSQFTSMSFLQNADMELRLPADELMVFLAAVDLRRKNAIASYIGSAETSDFKIEELLDHMETAQSNSLMHMLVNNYNYAVPERKEIEEILGKLIERKVIEQVDDYRLTEEYERFAVNFLIPQNVIMLEAFDQSSSDGMMVSAGMLFVTAGVKDICSFLFTDEEVEVSLVAAGHMLKTIENFLSCPELI